MKLIQLVIALAAAAIFVQDADEEHPKGPQIGEPAPVFRLNNHEGRAVAIGGASKTWTVVAFFPKAATPG